jgi:DNA-binding transcriptional regulator YhcF (GntR family)
MCKWLLRMNDLVGDELPLTQEFLAQMIGVRCTTVTEVAGELQKAGMIKYSRGRIGILDLEQIKRGLASATKISARTIGGYSARTSENARSGW